MKGAKAAALRAMLPWVADQRDGPGRRLPDAPCRLLRGLADMDAVYKGQPRFLTREQEDAAAGHCSAALQALAELARLTPDCPWCLIPKCHALLHIACDSAMGNPRVAHCYQDEDFVGKVKRMYTACHGKTAPRRSLQRYGASFCIRLRAREECMNGQRASKGAPRRGGGLRWSEPSSSAVAVTDLGLKRTRGRPPKLTVRRPKGRPKKKAGS